MIENIIRNYKSKKKLKGLAGQYDKDRDALDFIYEHYKVFERGPIWSFYLKQKRIKTVNKLYYNIIKVK